MNSHMLPAVSDAPLSPVSFLERSARVWADRPAVAGRGGRVSSGDHYRRVRQVCGALSGELRVSAGDRVATLLPNVPAMLELHYAVPGAGAVLVPLNTRLSADDYA